MRVDVRRRHDEAEVTVPDDASDGALARQREDVTSKPDVLVELGRDLQRGIRLNHDEDVRRREESQRLCGEGPAA